jgi:hypothetical protein
MLFDPEFAAHVRHDPAAALPDVPSTLRAQVAAIDARALKLDRLLRRRTLRTLFDEFKGSTTLFLARKKTLAALVDFFTSRAFHDAVASSRPLALAFADFLGDDASPPVKIERALAEARRMKPPRPDGRVHRAGGVVAIATTQGALVALQQAEQYLFEVGLMPAVALCDDAPALVLDARAEDRTPLYLVTVPSVSGGHSLVTIDEPLYRLLASLPRAFSADLAPLVDDELAVRT